MVQYGWTSKQYAEWKKLAYIYVFMYLIILFIWKNPEQANL